MRRPILALAAALCLLLLSGCALDPFDEETVAPLEDFQVRVTQGLGAADPFLSSVEVAPESTVQLAALIGDGRTVIFTVPRGPATQLDVVARLEGSSEVVASVPLRSLSGEPISAGGLFAFDPGYVGIEAKTRDDLLVLRVAAPRLTGTAQGQVPFTFKTNIAAGQ